MPTSADDEKATHVPNVEPRLGSKTLWYVVCKIGDRTGIDDSTSTRGPFLEDVKMGDDKSKTAPQDASKINVHEDYEVRYWTKHFGVSEDKLKDAVQKVGISADAVKKALGK